MVILLLDFIDDISIWETSQGLTEHSWLSVVFLLHKDAGGSSSRPKVLNYELLLITYHFANI